MIKVGIVGATGYAGAELVRLLLNHPQADLVAISSVSFEGKALNEVYPAYNGLCELICSNQEEVVEKSDVIFAALPHGLSQELAGDCNKSGKKFIDLGADFRLENEEDYKEWYGLTYLDKNLHENAIYALPELFREDIKGKEVVGNPGCYPTSIGLALAPALRNGLIETTGIICDSKSGTTGAGRGLAQNVHFADCNEAFGPYKVASHRHTPEIEQTLSHMAKEKITITFVPHLLPVNRGIISTCYAKLRKGINQEMVFDAYKKAYDNEFFVRVLKKGETANIKTVQYSNFCDISLHFDERTNTMIVVSAIDNMVKGAAGQAIQNMNILYNLDEKSGLNIVPPAF